MPFSTTWTLPADWRSTETMRDQGADVVEILRPRIVDLAVAVGGDDEPPVARQGVLDRPDRARPPDQQRDDVARKDDDVLQRQERIARLAYSSLTGSSRACPVSSHGTLPPVPGLGCPRHRREATTRSTQVQSRTLMIPQRRGSSEGAGPTRAARRRSKGHIARVRTQYRWPAALRQERVAARSRASLPVGCHRTGSGDHRRMVPARLGRDAGGRDDLRVGSMGGRRTANVSRARGDPDLARRRRRAIRRAQGEAVDPCGGIGRWTLPIGPRTLVVSGGPAGSNLAPRRSGRR